MNEEQYFQLPFASISNFLPYSDRKALKYAFYNSIAVICLVSIVFLCTIIFLVLQVFLRPIVWALLVGTCLFPCKFMLVTYFRQYLHRQKESGCPFCLSVLLTPIQLVQSSTESLLDAFWSKLMPITITVLSTGTFLFMQEFGLFTHIGLYFAKLHSSISSIFTLISLILSPKIIATFTIAHLLNSITGCIHMSSLFAKAFSTLMWFLIFITCTNWFGVLQPVIVVGLIVFIVCSYVIPENGKHFAVNNSCKRNFM